jgi:hypothetical protein
MTLYASDDKRNAICNEMCSSILHTMYTQIKLESRMMWKWNGIGFRVNVCWTIFILDIRQTIFPVHAPVLTYDNARLMK